MNNLLYSRHLSETVTSLRDSVSKRRAEGEDHYLATVRGPFRASPTERTGVSTGLTPVSSLFIRSFVPSLARAVDLVGHLSHPVHAPPQGGSSARYTLDEGCVWSNFQRRPPPTSAPSSVGPASGIVLPPASRVRPPPRHLVVSTHAPSSYQDSWTRYRDPRDRTREFRDNRDASGPTRRSIRPGFTGGDASDTLWTRGVCHASDDRFAHS